MQMKKFLLFTIGMVLSLTAGMAVSQALMATEDEVLLEIFEEAGVEFSDKRDVKELENLASNEEAPFANLYLFMLKNVKDGPHDAAVEEVANRYDYTEEEIEQIVLLGSTEPIIQKKELESQQIQDEANAADLDEASTQADADYEEFVESNDFDADLQEYLQWYYEVYEKPSSAEDLKQVLTTEFLVDEYSKISEAYDTELDFQQENRRLAYEALASEMFFNNDLEDSANIDILYDLDLIHYLMFGELITYPDRSGDPSVETASEEEPLALFDAPEPDENVVLAAESIDPYTCFGDVALEEALTAFEDDPPETDSALPETDESGIDYDVGDEDSADAEDSDASSGTDAESNPYSVDIGSAFEKLDSLLSSFEKLGQGDWTRELPCNDIFCIEVKFISETENPEVETEQDFLDYEEDENCIACHTAYIRERLTDTMSKSLVPSKITTNWFEDATCKEAGSFVNLDLNVYAIKRPIDLDPGDDLDEKAGEQIEDFKNTLFSLAGFPLPGGTKDIIGKTKDDKDCESILNLSDVANVERSIDELLDQCSEAAQENARQIQEAFDEFTFTTFSQSTSDLYQQVSAEFYTMLLYFQTFQEGLQRTYETDEAPLSSLLSKEYCK